MVRFVSGVTAAALGAALAAQIRTGASLGLEAVGCGPWGPGPLWAAGALGAAGGLIGAALVMRLASQGRPSPPSRAAFAAAAVIALAGLHGAFLPGIGDSCVRLVAGALPPRGGPLEGLLADISLAGVLVAPAAFSGAFFVGLAPSPAGARWTGLIALGAGLESVLSASSGSPAVPMWRGVPPSAYALFLVAIPASVALGWARREEEGGTPGGSAGPGWGDRRSRLVLALLAGTGGFAAAGLLLALSRLIRLVTGDGPLPAALITATALLPIGLGSFEAPRAIGRAGGSRRLLGYCAALAGILALVAGLAAGLIPFAYLDILALAGMSPSGEWAATFAAAGLALLGPSLFAGASIGAAVVMPRDGPLRDPAAGAATLRAAAPCAIAALGVAAGALAAPSVSGVIGLQGALTLWGLLLCVVGALIVLAGEGTLGSRATRSIALLGVGGLLLLKNDPWDVRLLTAAVSQRPGLFLEGGRSRLADRILHDRVLECRHGPHRTSAIRLVEGRLEVLFADGRSQPLGGLEARRGSSMAGHIPALLGGGTGGRALLLAAGAPGTAEAIAAHGGLEIEVAAVDPDAARIALAAASALRAEPPAEPPYSPMLLAVDARRALALDAGSFDRIVAPPLVREAEIEAIFDPVGLRRVRERLGPGGAAAIPVPIRALTREGIQAAISIFASVFPEGSVWAAGDELILLGGDGPVPPDLGTIGPRSRRRDVSASLAGIGLDDPLKILALQVAPVREIGAGHAPDPWQIRRAAARARLRPPLRENLSWIAGLMESGETPVAFPAHWSAGARGAVLQRLKVLRSVAQRCLAARAFLARGDAASALAAAEEALTGDPSDLEARDLAARSLAMEAASALERGDAASARAACERALDLDPDSIEALTALSWIRFTEGDRAGAEILLRRGVLVAPWIAILHYRLGLVRLESSDLDGAEASLRRAYDLDPRRSGTLLLLGDVARRRGRAADAERLYDRALALGGRQGETLTARAALRLETGRLDEAEDDLEAALRAKPGDAEALFTRARLRAARGERDAARLDLLTAVRTGGPDFRSRAMAEPSLRALLFEGPAGGEAR